MPAIQCKQANKTLLEILLKRIYYNIYISPFVNDITPTQDSVIQDFTLPTESMIILNKPSYDTSSSLCYRRLYHDLFAVDTGMGTPQLYYDKLKSVGWRNMSGQNVTVYGYVVFIDLGMSQFVAFATEKRNSITLNPYQSWSITFRMDYPDI